MDDPKFKVINDAIANIEKTFGKGIIMKLGDKPLKKIEAISTGCISLDYALGVGGIPKGRIIEIFGPQSGGKCVVGDTFILTEKGFLKIKECGNSPEETFTDSEMNLYTLNGMDKANKFYNGGIKKTLKINTRFGFELEGTLNHPVYGLEKECFFSFKKLEEIKEKDYVCIQRGQNIFSKEVFSFPKFKFIKKRNDNNSKFYKIPKKVNLNFAKFAAYLIAEGYTNWSNSFTFHNTDRNLLKDYEKLVKCLFDYTPIYRKDPKTKVTSYDVNSVHIKNFLIEYEICKGVSKDKVIPCCILQSSKKIISQFLQTFFDCEGYVGINKNSWIEISTASEMLGIQLQLLLLNFGIISKRKNLENTITRRRKSNSTNINSIPYTEVLIRKIRHDIIEEQGTRKGGSNRKGKGFKSIVGNGLSCRLDSIHRGHCKLTYKVAESVLNKLKKYSHLQSVRDLQTIVNNNFFFDTISSIKPASNQVYDFSVPNNYSFFSNGFISHNTTMSLHVLAECQKSGGVAAFIDVEHCLSLQYASDIGVDVSNLILSQPDYGEQALEIVDTLVRTNAIDIIIIDSVAALTPKAEIEGEMGQHHMAIQARLMSQALRKLTASVSKAKTCLIFINQLRDRVGIIFGNPEETPGGKALKFYSSVRLDVRKISVMKEGKEVYGNRTRIKVVKNKVAPPFREVEVDIIFGKGIDIKGDLINLAVQFDIIKKSGAWYTYEEDRYQGKEQLKEALLSIPTIFDNLKLRVKDVMGNKRPNIVSNKEVTDEIIIEEENA